MIVSFEVFKHIEGSLLLLMENLKLQTGLV